MCYFDITILVTNLFYFPFCSLQFDAPEDTPNVRQYCLCVPEKSEISVHNCHFTNTSFCGACIYVHGEGARPWITHCTVSNANNVGIFVDDHAQVRIVILTHVKLTTVYLITGGVTTFTKSILSASITFFDACFLHYCRVGLTTMISTATSWPECGSRTMPHQCSEKTKYIMEKMWASLSSKMDR